MALVGASWSETKNSTLEYVMPLAEILDSEARFGQDFKFKFIQDADVWVRCAFGNVSL